ncbi:MAG: vitamin B12-dependent ribonucleotide reductase [Planctomycetota bacterium]|nr:vitamin B12-dependent ribonucleotide reductase [Planctomycetota bacterium]
MGSTAAAPRGGREEGLKIERRFTRDAEGKRLDPGDTVEWERRTCRILNSDGSVVFEAQDVEIPRSWSTVAGDIMASKYMRKAGVPQFDAEGKPLVDEQGTQLTGSEKSVRQVVGRLVKCWRHWGETYGYFATPEDAAAFEDELSYMLFHQVAAPNSPQWFNTGVHHSYGIDGPSQGHYYVDEETKKVTVSSDAYSRPQPHACFIQSVNDDLVNAGGIMDLWVREARLFKYGSGTGSNFSAIRGEGEPLAGGGFSSGLMSFLKIGDRAAGAIKSGGTTRRAAKMVCLDMNHPDIELFVNWKANEERKVRALISAGYPADFNGEAYATISGQNSNNSVRVPDSFLTAIENDGDWQLRWRTDGRVSKTLKARHLWDQVIRAAWHCADPGVQYDTTINDWHTCPASGRINASNPCSEYMFLDNTACNLASINLRKFFDAENRHFDVEAFRHACRLWTIVLEISVLMAQYPSAGIAELSYRFRTLGLGYANLGTLLMLSGIPYDSPQGRSICGAITAIMTAEAYGTSAEMARNLGPFPGFEENREGVLRVMRNHRAAAYNADPESYEGLSTIPQGIEERFCWPYLVEAARESWDRVVELGEKHGFRNAQSTVIAPTGTIGLLMDCDTTGIEPDYSLVKFKKLAGGGYFKIPNRSVQQALEVLGYTRQQADEMLAYMVGTATLKGAPGINWENLIAKGFLPEDLEAVEASLAQVFELSFAFTVWNLGEGCLERLGIESQAAKAPGFNLLRALGFSEEQIGAANEHACGRHTLEGAPHLRSEHLPVFDCANRCGRIGRRFIPPEGHIRMMAAAQPFISGAISKTINLPRESTVSDISEAYTLSWKLGLKSVALYRDGCKMSQPLSTSSDSSESSTSTVSAGAPASGTEKTAGEPVADARCEELPSETPAVAEETVAGGARRENGVSLPGSLEEAAACRHRRPLPAKRHGFTQEAKVGGHKLYVRTGQYEDGSLGEIFIDMHKEGAAFRAIMNCFAIAVSKGLQYGVPLEEFVETFTFTRFAPQGQVHGHPNIKMATSIVDYIFRLLGLEYLGRQDFVHVKRGEFRDRDPAESLSASERRAPARPEPVGASEPLGRSGGDEAVSAQPARAANRSPEVPEAAEALPSYAPENRISKAISLSEAVSPFGYDEQLEEFMGDAPPCEKCGHTTIRNGACYRCLVCGESMGCS